MKELLLLREQLFQKNRPASDPSTDSNEDDAGNNDIDYLSSSPREGGTSNAEDWGHFFDYGDSSSPSNPNNRSGASSSGTNSTILSIPGISHSNKAAMAALKRDFATEKRKMRSQFEYEMKKLETSLRQQLKAREKEMMEMKSNHSKKDEETQEKIKAIKLDNEREIDNLKITHREAIKQHHTKNKVMLKKLEEESNLNKLALSEKEESFRERLEAVGRDYRNQLSNKEAELKGKQLVIDDLKNRVNQANRAVSISLEQMEKNQKSMLSNKGDGDKAYLEHQMVSQVCTNYYYYSKYDNNSSPSPFRISN